MDDLRDRFWMERAFAAAREGWGRALPNPCVGAVLVRDGVWYLDSEVQDGNPLAGRSFKVDDDYFFVMGDHRNNSNDSRALGSISRNMIVGHVWHILYPFDSWRGVE